MQSPGVSEETARSDTLPLECSHGEGERQLGIFVGSDEAKQRWAEEKVETLVAEAKRLAEFARESPQRVYSGLSILLHQKWKFFQRVNPDVGPHLVPQDAALRDDFLTDLLGIK